MISVSSGNRVPAQSPIQAARLTQTVRRRQGRSVQRTEEGDRRAEDADSCGLPHPPPNFPVYTSTTGEHKLLTSRSQSASLRWPN